MPRHSLLTAITRDITSWNRTILPNQSTSRPSTSQRDDDTYGNPNYASDVRAWLSSTASTYSAGPHEHAESFPPNSIHDMPSRAREYPEDRQRQHRHDSSRHDRRRSDATRPKATRTYSAPNKGESGNGRTTAKDGLSRTNTESSRRAVSSTQGSRLSPIGRAVGRDSLSGRGSYPSTPLEEGAPVEAYASGVGSREQERKDRRESRRDGRRDDERRGRRDDDREGRRRSVAEVDGYRSHVYRR